MVISCARDARGTAILVSNDTVRDDVVNEGTTRIGGRIFGSQVNQLLCRNPVDKPAMREKLYGIWTPISWTEWLERARQVTYALHSIGFRPGDVGSVLANTVPEWNSGHRANRGGLRRHQRVCRL